MTEQSERERKSQISPHLRANGKLPDDGVCDDHGKFACPRCYGRGDHLKGKSDER